jgi:hypothetical protein
MLKKIEPIFSSDALAEILSLSSLTLAPHKNKNE